MLPILKWSQGKPKGINPPYLSRDNQSAYTQQNYKVAVAIISCFNADHKPSSQKKLATRQAVTSTYCRIIHCVRKVP